MILWSLMNDLMMHEMLWFSFWTIWYACMDAWMHEWNLLFFFSFFHFFINLRNVWGVMHMHTLWIIDDVWHAMIFFLNLDDDACMDAWMHGWNLLYSKRWITHVCMTWYGVWIFLLQFFENKFELIPISLLFWIHGIILLWFFFYFFLKLFLWSNQFTNKHFFNHFFETLLELHTWNCQWLEKLWMRWWRLTRELPQFELVSGHKICLGFPQLLMIWRKWWGFKKNFPWCESQGWS